jgi:hypothetical protein
MRWLFAPILALMLLSGTGQAQKMAEPITMYNPHGSMADMMNLFVKDSPWPEAAKKTQVLVLVHYWIVASPLDQVRQVVEFAKRHHMKIDLSVEPIRKYKTDTCPEFEGYTNQGQLAAAVAVLKSLDADVSQVEMDEPLWFGTYSNNIGDCQFPLQETINRTALNMKEVLAVYPNIMISDIEPIPGVTNVSTWKQDLATLETGLAQQLGSTIRFVQLDINWPNSGWPRALIEMRDFLLHRNEGLGIIYNGSPLATNNQDWINSAIANVETIEGAMHIVPGMASFQTWNPYPSCNLPETSPTTLTWWINRYFRPRTTLAAQFQGQGANGRLTTMDGTPIANATVNGYAPGINFSRPLPTAVIQGVVPAAAAYVIFGVRLNTECGNCAGTNDVLLGALQYQEIQGGSAQMTWSLPSTPRVENGAIFGSEIVGGRAVTRIITMPGQSVLYNSPWLPVTPNANYVFVVPAATVGGQGWSGNVNLIWVYANGGSRYTIVPNAGKVLESSAVTAADGTFSLPILPRNVDSPFPVTIEFDGGGGAYRSTIWTPPP